MISKPKVLLCWGYNRKNWIEFFEALNNDFEFVYLFYMYPSDEREVYTENKRIFYTDYKSAKELLESVNPSKVVLMGLDGLQTIALNVQCKKMHIPTYYMTHGSATFSIDDYRDHSTADRNLLKETFTHKIKSWLFTFKFLTGALGTKYISGLPSLLRFQLDKLKVHPLLAMEKNKSPLRIPTHYIVFSNEDAEFYTKLDNSDPAKVIVLGNMEITEAIKMSKDRGVHDLGYLLYIETPLSVLEDNEYDINKITVEENNAIIDAMNKYALGHGLKLIVKLHPYSYKNTFFIQHPNISYEKNDKKESLILDAHAVIFYNSSLAIPSLFFKPCCMFTVNRLDSFQASVAELGVCTVVDYKDIISDPERISFFTPDASARKAFVDKYIGEGADGKGLDRLRNTLLQ